jgi:hypothetical protein
VRNELSWGHWSFKRDRINEYRHIKKTEKTVEKGRGLRVIISRKKAKRGREQ